MNRLCALLVLCGLALPAEAIPAFARRYKTSCTTCHVLPPQLNSFGRAFRANGYRMPAGDPEPAAKDIPLGAPEWEGLFPRAFLPGAVSESAPLAGIVFGEITKDRAHAVDTENSFAVLGLLSAGNLGKRVSWFGAASVGPNGANFERAFASYDHIEGPWLNVRAGYVEPSAVPFSRYTQRLSSEGYFAFEQPQGATRLVIGATKPALEIFGAGSDPGPLRGLEYSLGVAGRTATGGLAGDTYGRISYKFGGLAAAGDLSGTPGKSGPVTAPLDEETLRVGAFVYRATFAGPDARPRGYRAGADAQLLYRRLEIFVSAWLGADSQSAALPARDLHSVLAGASVRPWPWLLVMGRYEAAIADGGPSTRRTVGTVRLALQQNVAVTADLSLEMPDVNAVELAGALFLAF